jgi:hypothetical protein
MTVKKLLHLLSAAVILMGVMAASAYAHPGHVHVHSSPALARAAGEKMALHLNAGVTTIDPAKTIALREKTSSRAEIVKASLAPLTALDEEVSTEGAGCIREHCACGPSTHGNPWCYTSSRGDCPNHQGLLCVWSN